MSGGVFVVAGFAHMHVVFGHVFHILRLLFVAKRVPAPFGVLSNLSFNRMSRSVRDMGEDSSRASSSNACSSPMSAVSRTVLSSTSSYRVRTMRMVSLPGRLTVISYPA